MRNKVLVASLLAGFGLMALVVVAAVTAFAFVDGSPVQAEEAIIQEAPVQAEPVQQVNTVKPAVQQVERTSYANKTGGCSYESAKQLMVDQAPSQTNPDQLLTLADAQ